MAQNLKSTTLRELATIKADSNNSYDDLLYNRLTSSCPTATAKRWLFAAWGEYNAHFRKRRGDEFGVTTLR